MKQAGIYAIVNSVNGKSYVGSSRDVRARWWSHRCNLRKGKRENPVLQNAWNKYGEEAFVFTILEVIEHYDNIEDLKLKLTEREQYHIDTLRPAYNVRPIAQNNTGYHPRPESVEKMIASVTGLKRSQATKDLLRDARLGMKFSEEWCENISKGKSNPSGVSRKKMSDAKTGIEPKKATDAAAIVNRGKSRPPEVVEKIRASRLARWEQQKAEGYKPPQDEKTGKFLKSSE